MAMILEVPADVSVKIALSGNVISCSFVHGYTRLGEIRILHLEHLITFRKNLFCKHESEGSSLLADYTHTHTTVSRLHTYPHNCQQTTHIPTHLLAVLPYLFLVLGL